MDASGVECDIFVGRYPEVEKSGMTHELIIFTHEINLEWMVGSERTTGEEKVKNVSGDRVRVDGRDSLEALV